MSTAVQTQCHWCGLSESKKRMLIAVSVAIGIHVAVVALLGAIGAVASFKSRPQQRVFDLGSITIHAEGFKRRAHK